MLRIGIIGAESSHTLEFARILNIQKDCGAARVVALWGETRSLAERAAEAGGIPLVIPHPKEMLGKIDAVIIAHRHPKYHIPAAWHFLNAGIPIFIDKPLCQSPSEGREFLQAARDKNVSVTSFSILPEQNCFKNDINARENKLQNALKLTLFYNLINPKINPFFTQINPNNAPNYYKTQKKLGGAPY